VPSATPPTNREEQLEAEVRQLREVVERLSIQVDRLSANQNSGAAPVSTPAAAPAPTAVERLPDSVSATGAPRGTMEGTSPRFPITMPSQFDIRAGITSFGPGFQIQSEDEEYRFQFHDLTQFDGRFFIERPQVSVQDTFVIPRQWFIFSGRLTKPFEYYVSSAEGFDTLNILDVFLNVHYDDRLQFKIGRYKTPFTYEFYSLPINGLISPERSLFFNNFGVNRDLGIMAWGNLFEDHFESVSVNSPQARSSLRSMMWIIVM
jgi:phosphate-selective porin OprO/OprP